MCTLGGLNCKKRWWNYLKSFLVEYNRPWISLCYYISIHMWSIDTIKSIVKLMQLFCLMNKNNVLRNLGKGPNFFVWFIFMFVVFRKIEPKLFLVDNLEFGTFHCLICLSLGNQYHVVPSRWMDVSSTLKL